VSALWLWGTVIPVAITGYVFIARMAYRFADKRWPQGEYDEDCLPAGIFGIFWPVAAPLWLLYRYVLNPTWHSWDGCADWVTKHAKEDGDK